MSVLSPEAAPAVGLPTLRLLPVPPHAPPYDDELPVPPPAVSRRLGPLCDLTPPPLRLVPQPAAPTDEEVPALTRSADLPPPRPIALALVQGLLEVLAGVRPVSQLQRGTTPELFLTLEQLVHSRPRAQGARPATGAVRSVHLQERPEGVVEVCATVHRGARFGALALRLEGRGDRWCCTEVAGL